MPDLAEFLLARIAEEVGLSEGSIEAGMARHGQEIVFDDVRFLGLGPERGWVEMDCRRLLAECVAKRRIVEEHEQGEIPLIVNIGGKYPSGKCSTCVDWGNADWEGAPAIDYPCDTLKLLALPYADHPGYDESWRP